MTRKKKLSTPTWILEGYESKEKYEESKGIKVETKDEKTFVVKRCPECKSDDVGVVLGRDESGRKGEWECKNCPWEGRNTDEERLPEEEFMKYLDEKGEEIL